MARLSIISLIFILLSSSLVYATSRNTEHEEIVPFELVEGMILVSAKYDGQLGNFVFDTGSSQIFLHQLDFDKSKKVKLYTAAGTVWASQADISSVELGRVHIKDVAAIGMDLTQISKDTNRDIKGVIGWSILGDRSITIDYKNKNIHIGAVKDMSQLVIGDYHILKLDMTRVMDDLPIIDIAIRGESYSFAFDTGAPINVIDNKVASALFNKKGKTNRLFVDDIVLNDMLRIENSLLRSVDLSDFNISEANKKLDGILSVNNLGAEIVLIDKETNRIFIFWNKEHLDSRDQNLGE